MQETRTYFATIHDQQAGVLAFDLKDTFCALAGVLKPLTWRVSRLDAVGQDCQRLCDALQAAGSEGMWLSTMELLDWVGRCHQTIEGEFLGLPEGLAKEVLGPNDFDLRNFNESKAELAIVAVDSTLFAIYSKDAQVTEAFGQSLPRCAGATSGRALGQLS